MSACVFLFFLFLVSSPPRLRRLTWFWNYYRRWLSKLTERAEQLTRFAIHFERHFSSYNGYPSTCIYSSETYKSQRRTAPEERRGNVRFDFAIGRIVLIKANECKRVGFHKSQFRISWYTKSELNRWMKRWMALLRANERVRIYYLLILNGILMCRRMRMQNLFHFSANEISLLRCGSTRSRHERETEKERRKENDGKIKFRKRIKWKWLHVTFGRVQQRMQLRAAGNDASATE